ncbi:MAG: hypothetical protein H6591_03110 [Flavobacteriales bacterium]|nr:hypothetical protein [Flavobacteriales bacterium]
MRTIGMKPFLFLLLTQPLALKAQEPRGGCSIALLSDSSTLYQHWCLGTPTETIEPIVWLVQGTGVQVLFLPPGVTATFSGDTLTIAGTITTEGHYNPHITTSEGCTSLNMVLEMSVIVDPQFSCSVEGEDVILRWPGINAPQQYGWDMYVACTTSDGFVEVMVVILPDADSLIWSGLPTNTELLFDLTGNGAPYCFPGYYESSCTIITSGVGEHAQGDMQVRAVPHGDRLELSAPVTLSEVRVNDMVGGLVTALKVNAFTASLPIASLVPGVYLLHVVGADGRVDAQRFVKDH